MRTGDFEGQHSSGNGFGIGGPEENESVRFALETQAKLQRNDPPDAWLCYMDRVLRNKSLTETNMVTINKEVTQH